MQLDNDFVKKKFDNIDGKIDFMIEFCQILKLENKELLLKNLGLEAKLDKNRESKEAFSKQEALFQSKINRYLNKLNGF